MTTKKKLSYFIFICCCLLTVPAFLSNPAAGDQNSTTLVITGTVPLVIYNTSFSGIDTGAPTFFWNTNDRANSTVKYGPTSSYGSVSFESTKMGFFHSITLKGLSQNTTYHYQIMSTNLAGRTAISSDFLFQTSGNSTGTQNTSTTTQSLISPWLQTTTVTTGNQGYVINSTEAAQSGITVTSASNVITVNQPGMTMTIVSSGTPSIVNGSFSGNVQSVSIFTTPPAATMSFGSVGVSISASLATIPENAAISTAISETVSSDANNGFQLAALDTHQQLEAVAYVMNVTKTNFVSTGPATVTMSVPSGWVTSHGGIGSIYIERIADDNTVTMLDTSYTGTNAQGNMVFQADSPHGLCVFGITAITPIQPVPPPAPVIAGPGGGGGGGGGSSSGSGIAQSALGALQSIGQMLAPPESVSTTAQSLGGLWLQTTGPTGNQAYIIDTAKAAQSGVSVTIANNVITTIQPGLTMAIVSTGTPSVKNGMISGYVQSASISTTPSAIDTSFGSVGASIDASFTTIPEKAAILTTLSEKVSSEVHNAFQAAAQDNNRQVEAIAYVMDITKTNFVTTGPATVTMTIPPDWVTSHGGTESVAIVRIGDDNAVSILDTSYKGMDAEGNMVFKGNSPQGLCVFGIGTLTPAPQAKPGASSGAPSTISGAVALVGGIAGLITNKYVLIIIVIICLVYSGVLVYAIWNKQRRAQKKRK